jgi:hypothetical protein
MDGNIPLLYIGSGTAFKGGVLYRCRSYWKGKTLPKAIIKALKKGYRITEVRVLVVCPTPLCGDLTTFRTLLVAIEAVFAVLFSALLNREKAYSFPKICPWPAQSFEYAGLCSHNPLLEAIKGDTTATGAELRKAQRERDRAYQYKYQRKIRANPTEEYRRRMRIHNQKQRPFTKERQRKAREVHCYYCAPCDVNCRDASSLRRHLSTLAHGAIIEHGGKDSDGYVHCQTCPSFRTQSNAGFALHIKSNFHLGLSNWLLNFILLFVHVLTPTQI